MTGLGRAGRTGTRHRVSQRPRASPGGESAAPGVRQVAGLRALMLSEKTSAELADLTFEPTRLQQEVKRMLRRGPACRRRARSAVGARGRLCAWLFCA
jgi:hypothetical protein